MDAEVKKQINGLRFGWHEQVLRDAELRRRPTALLFASHIMHRFDPTAGFASISLRAAAKALNLDRTSVVRARDALIRRGWVQKLADVINERGEHLPTRYSLAGGPDDLDVMLHTAMTIEPPAMPELPFLGEPVEQKNGSPA
jgi:hypothetical protein